MKRIGAENVRIKCENEEDHHRARLGENFVLYFCTERWEVSDPFSEAEEKFTGVLKLLRRNLLRLSLSKSVEILRLPSNSICLKAKKIISAMYAEAVSKHLALEQECPAYHKVKTKRQ